MSHFSCLRTARDLVIVLSFIFSCLLDAYEEQKLRQAVTSLSYRFKSTFILLLCVPNLLFVFDSFWSFGFLNHILLWGMRGVDGATLSVSLPHFPGPWGSDAGHQAWRQAPLLQSHLFKPGFGCHSLHFSVPLPAIPIAFVGSPLCINKWHYSSPFSFNKQIIPLQFCVCISNLPVVSSTLSFMSYLLNGIMTLTWQLTRRHFDSHPCELWWLKCSVGETFILGISWWFKCFIDETFIFFFFLRWGLTL